jgi:hypothetical protein
MLATARRLMTDAISREIAVEFLKRIDLATKGLFDAGEALRGNLSQEHFRILAEALANALIELDLGIAEIIYRCHPDLRPEDCVAVATLREIERGVCKIKEPR